MRDFSLRFGGSDTNIVGDFTFTGASVLCVEKENGECDWNYNGYLYDADTKYVKDDDSFLLNSASARLNLPQEVKRENILWAGLYWQGHINGDDPLDYEDAIDGFNEVVFETPDGVKHTITAPLNNINSVNYYSFKSEDQDPKGFRFFYQCFADVTSLVKNSYSSSNNIFTVGDIKTSKGKDFYIGDPLFNWGSVKYGHWGGWSLIVVYERNSPDESYKNISIFDGFKALIPSTIEPEKSIEIPVSGFLTPFSGEIDSRLLYFAMGGEKKIARDRMEIYRQHAQTFQKVYNSINEEDNVLNGSISFMGNYVNPSRQYVPGLDLDLFDASDWIEHDQNMTILKLSAVFKNHNGDQTFTGVIAFSTKINSPLIDNFLKTSNKGANYILKPGDEIEYTLDFKNTGSEKASEVTIYDDFRENNLTHFIEDDKDFILDSIKLSADNDIGHFYCRNSNLQGCDYSFDSNQNCSVDLDENGSVTGVRCSFDSLEVNHRRVMKFKVKIKNDFISPEDIEIKNIAHSKYKNARTNEWVDAIGKSNPYVAGKIEGIAVESGDFDVIDNILNGYQKDKGIKTKIASDSYYFDILTVDNSFHQKPFHNYSDIYFIFRLKDFSDSSYTPLLKDQSLNPAIAILHNGDNFARLQNKAVMPKRAIKRAKLKVKYINFAKLYKQNHSTCLVRADNSANIAAMPQCVNSTSLYKEAFGQSAFDRCVVNNGSPCTSSKHGVGNTPYDHIYGCYECTADALGSFFVSTDDFAIRPYMFEFDLPSSEISGNLFSFKVKALDKNLDPLPRYSETLNDSYKIEYKERKVGCKKGVLNLNGANFSNGIIDKSTYYSEIGVLDLNISEIAGREFATVDADDTPLSERLIRSDFDFITFVPFKFDVLWNLKNADTSKNYTYFSNDILNMGGKLSLNIKAKNKNNHIVENYSSSCYAKDTNITVTFSALGSESSLMSLNWADFDVPSHKKEGAVSFNLPINNINFKIDFPSARFVSGESNSTFMINFKREKNKALEPMKIKVSKIRVNDSDIFGESIHDEYLTYYYSRIKVLDYPNIIGDILDDAPIYYETYCKNCDKSVFALANEPLSASGELFWYQNPYHSSFEGHVISASSLHGTSVNDLRLKRFDLKAPSLPHSDTISFVPSSWLVYDASNPLASSIKFNVNFLNANTKWVGVGKLGHVVDENISIRKNRKISW